MKRTKEKVFSEAFEAYANELFRHAVLRLSNRDRAQELTQECFLRAWQYVSRGEEIEEIRPFLYRTLRNLIIDEYRKKKSVSLDEMLEGDDGTQMETSLLRDDTDEMEQAMERFDGAQAAALLQELAEPYKEVVTLRYISSMTIGEIAEQIGESENVVSVRIHRGLKKLKALLEERTQA